MVDFFGFFKLYGLMVGFGILAGGYVASMFAKREKMDPETVWDSLVWMVLFGLVGARAYHVIDLWDYYSKNLNEIVAVWHGGIGIYGGLIGGLVGLILFTKSNQISNLKFLISNKFSNDQLKNDRKNKSNISTLKLLDVAAFGLPVGQAIGRWGNYFNQELYGKPTNLPWGIFVDLKNRMSGFEQYERFHPLFLYESILNIILFGLLFLVYIKIKKMFVSSKQRTSSGWGVGNGKFVGMYLVGYGLIRLMLEALRMNSWRVGNVPMASLFSIGIIVCGLVLLKSKIKNEKQNRE